ncbi:MAG: ABC transporter permease, partial [Xanthobacteraceae bacterium]
MTAEAARTAAAIPAVLRAIAWGAVRLIVILGVLLAWELTARSGLVTPFMLPRFTAVLERIWADAASGELAVN